MAMTSFQSLLLFNSLYLNSVCQNSNSNAVIAAAAAAACTNTNKQQQHKHFESKPSLQPPKLESVSPIKLSDKGDDGEEEEDSAATAADQLESNVSFLFLLVFNLDLFVLVFLSNFE